MSPVAIFKLLKAAKTVRDYVVRENGLDLQIDAMHKRVAKLEKNSHPPKSYIDCDRCSAKIKQYEGTD